MSYRVINKTLNAEYGIDTITTFFNFRKISLLEIQDFKSQENKLKEQNNEIKNINEQIINASIGEVSIESLLNLDSERFLEIQKKEKVFKDEKINEDKKIDKIIDIEDIKIEEDEIKDSYKDIIYESFDDKLYHTQFSILYSYLNKDIFDRYDLGCIAWSINKIFSVFFQPLFDELELIIKEKNITGSEGYIKKLKSGKKIEFYEMFRFINRIYETNHRDIISSISSQNNKLRINFLRSFLEKESRGGEAKSSYFYIAILPQLKDLRDFHAHEDNNNIEKLKKQDTMKIKEKFYNKFLGNLSEDGSGFLQILINGEGEDIDILTEGE